MPDFIAWFNPITSHRAADTRPHIALSRRKLRGIQAGLIAHCRIRAHIGTSNPQVKEDRAGTIGTRATRTSNPTPRSPGSALHPRRIQPKAEPPRAPGVDLFNQVQGMQGVGLTRPRSAAALVNPSHSAGFAKYDGNAGERILILCMTLRVCGDRRNRERGFHNYLGGSGAKPNAARLL